MTTLTGRPLRLETVQRVACWGDWAHWAGRTLANGMPIDCGPVAALELGDRAAAWLLTPSTVAEDGYRARMADYVERVSR